jgi:hypothetical protein
MAVMYNEKNVECLHCHKTINNVEVPNEKGELFSFQCPICKGWLLVNKDAKVYACKDCFHYTRLCNKAINRDVMLENCMGFRKNE